MFVAFAKIQEHEESILPFSSYGSSVGQGNEEGREVQYFLLLPQGFEGFSSDLPHAMWCYLMLVKYFWMVKRMVVGFCSLGVDATLG